ncbi:MAG: DJ-1/PfpI family protein [Calditrichaceae bacterium]|nr:DJ-1/PfpI family protein [Calditrichaceae bacterium]MBN2710447.1 DJ-1/PfpI family protein [Calditrichaceae bacterium]RQV93617.1 MAG: DJ-1/PfpI family protein [Calditrichota bacterium]
MASALILLSPGFEEIEAITVIDLLRRASIEVTTAGLDTNLITGSHQISVKADEFYKDCDQMKFDILILPGGQPGTNNMKKDPLILSWIKQRFESKKWIAAICAAPIILYEAGIAKGLKLTSYPSEEHVFIDSIYLKQPVVTDGCVITGRGVGTAIDFSLEIITKLIGKKTAEETAKRILYT